jgi:hypothetical protein
VWLFSLTVVFGTVALSTQAFQLATGLGGLRNWRLLLHEIVEPTWFCAMPDGLSFGFGSTTKFGSSRQRFLQ